MDRSGLPCAADALSHAVTKLEEENEELRQELGEVRKENQILSKKVQEQKARLKEALNG